jgi:hypothetical protein
MVRNSIDSTLSVPGGVAVIARALTRRLTRSVTPGLALGLVFAVSGCGVDKNKLAEPLPVDELPADSVLREMLDAATDDAYLNRRLNLRDHAAWQIVHGILAYEHDFVVADEQGRLVPALKYLLDGGEMQGWILRPGTSLDENGRRGVVAVLDAGSTIGQGHADQWLGYLADCNLPIDQVIKVAGRDHTLADMLRQAEWDVPANETREYSWTLMALTTYYPTDHEWTASDGKRWSVPQLMEIEVGHDLAGSACGGTHRMSGIVMALNRHKQQGGALEGAWAAADGKVRECRVLAREYQNNDGSLSTRFFSGPGSSLEIKSSLHATGHTFEFLVMASDDQQVREDWLRRAAVNLCELLEATSDVDLECGALYHAIRGLTLYRERLFGSRPFPRERILPGS